MAVAMAVASTAVALPSPQDAAAPDADGRAMYAGLRAQALGMTAAELGLPADQPAYGVMMEFAVDAEIVSLIAFGAGDASLYFSPGGGMIGGIDRPPVAAAARSMVAAAGSVAADLPLTETFPRPQGDEIRFYILTPGGVRTGSATAETLLSGRHPLSPLFFAANDIITGFRTAQQ